MTVRLIALCLALLCAPLHAQMDHSHMPLNVPEGAPVPALTLNLEADSMSGYNLHLDIRLFKLEPPPGAMSMRQMMSATRDADSGLLNGHAHLYVNGRKIQRLYGPDVHLPVKLFDTGKINQITVTLNNHGHMDLVHDGRQILASLFVEPGANPEIVHRFDARPPQD